MAVTMCILSTLVVLILASVWIGISSIWAIEKRVNAIGDQLSEVSRNVLKVTAINDHLLKELHLTAQWNYDLHRFIIVSVCSECYRTRNYPDPCCRHCNGSSSIRLGLSENEIKSLKMKLDEIDRHVINKTV
jgi:hypothetical protein